MTNQSFSPGGMPPAAGLIMEDLTHGLNEWRNIQDIVRLTFKAFHDVLRAQGDAIKALERNLDTKAGKAEVASALQGKANASDTAGRLREVEAVIATKADITDMERRALKTEVDAALRTQASDIYALLRTKADDAEFKTFKEHVERQLAALRAELARLGKGLDDTRVALDSKAGVVEVSAALAQKADLAEMEDKLRDKVSKKAFAEALSRKADTTALDQLEGLVKQDLADIQGALMRKADASALEEVSGRCERLRQRVEADSDTTAAALRTISSTFDSTLADVRSRLEGCNGQVVALNRNMSAMESAVREQEQHLREALGKKMDASDAYRLLDKKADLSGVMEALSHKANDDTVAALLAKVDDALDLGSKFEALQKEMYHKLGDQKSIYSMLDGLAKIEDVNKALLEVCAELEQKAPGGEVARLERQQAVINSGFAQNLHMGRWLWKSAKTKAGGAVPWEVQAVNTDSDNYVWEEGKATIMTVLPGLYEVSFGFYSRRKPVVQLLVNGEVVITAVNSHAHGVHHSGSSGAPKSPQAGGSGGNVTGLTCFDVLSLPPKAKVAITYQGEDRGEGFVCLRKL